MSRSSSRGAVVVTGASTGIGRACALRLASHGYQVFAGVRKEADAQSLRRAAQGQLTPIFLDVCDDDQIAAAARTVAEATGGRGLAGLINNAGVGYLAPSEVLPMELIRRQFEVNVFGQIAVTQAFLPQLRKAAGRVINMGSIGDRVVLPFGGPLNGSKWAFAAFNDALRIELRPWGIHVVLIEPAAIKSNAADKLCAEAEATIAALSDDARGLYADAYRGTVKAFTGHSTKFGSSPDVVARKVLRAMTAERPKTRYLVGRSGRPLAAIARFVPDRGFDQIRLRVFKFPDKTFGSRRHELPPSVVGLHEPAPEPPAYATAFEDTAATR